MESSAPIETVAQQEEEATRLASLSTRMAHMEMKQLRKSEGIGHVKEKRKRGAKPHKPRWRNGAGMDDGQIQDTNTEIKQ